MCVLIQSLHRSKVATTLIIQYIACGTNSQNMHYFAKSKW